MELVRTLIDGVLVVKPQVFGDNRGFFFECYNERRFEELTGMTVNFVQDNESKSKYGVLRGLHFQKPPFSQSKLVRVVSGKVLDVAVDIRHGSPTFGKYVAVELSGDNHYQLFLPKGIAHGFVVLSDEAVFAYKCDSYYEPSSECAIAWNDPDINVNWPVPAEHIILSEKDKHNKNLKEIEPFFHV